MKRPDLDTIKSCAEVSSGITSAKTILELVSYIEYLDATMSDMKKRILNVSKSKDYTRKELIEYFEYLATVALLSERPIRSRIISTSLATIKYLELDDVKN